MQPAVTSLYHTNSAHRVSWKVNKNGNNADSVFCADGGIARTLTFLWKSRHKAPSMAAEDPIGEIVANPWCG